MNLVDKSLKIKTVANVQGQPGHEVDGDAHANHM